MSGLALYATPGTQTETNMADKTPKSLAWSELLTRVSSLVREHAEDASPDKKFRTREQIFAEFLETREGSALYTTWRSASDVLIQKLKDQPVFGPIAPIVDGLIAHGGKEVRQRDPGLTPAAAVTKFLETQDGQKLYEVGRSLPAGATFEGNPKAISRALAIVRELVIEKGTRRFVAEFPLTLKMSGLLKACDRA